MSAADQCVRGEVNILLLERGGVGGGISGVLAIVLENCYTAEKNTIINQFFWGVMKYLAMCCVCGIFFLIL